MLIVLKNSWALLLGLMLLMAGNGLQVTALGLRGDVEGFDASVMAWVMSGYFAGFLLGSRMAPLMIKSVGHVRVFAALGSMISAAFILFPAFPDPVVWFFLRIVIGFSFSGVYVVAESWLNEASDNSIRGQAMSAYLIVQMAGIIAAQYLATLADASGFGLFVLMSVLVSLAFLPSLLSPANAPDFRSTKPMSLAELYRVSPLGLVGSLLLGAVFAASFAMASVYGTQKHMSIGEITSFVAIIYLGGLLAQYPLGWLSDRMDRRLLIIAITGGCAVVMALGFFLTDYVPVRLALGFVMGAVANPLYSLLIAYTNDYLEPADMPAASGGLIFSSGLGALAGPHLVGWMMKHWGADTYFLYVAVLMAMIAGYGYWRQSQRSRAGIGSSPVVPVPPQAATLDQGR